MTTITRLGIRSAPQEPAVEGEEIQYHDRNVEMFTERLAVKARIAELQDIDPADLTPVEKRELQRKARRLDDLDTEIVRFNYGLVRNYTKKFTSNSSREDTDDFEAAGVVGLMRAIDSFDPSKGRFGQWTYKHIQREVLKAVRDADFKSMNPGDFERRPSILRAYNQLQKGDEGVKPTHAQVAKAAGVTIDQVRRVLDAPHLESLHQRVGDDGDTQLGDLVESGDTGVEETVLTAMTLTALEDFGLRALDPRELLVLVRRFGLDCEPEQKLSSIGDMLNLSREAVRQVEAKALSKIMHPVIMRKIYRNGRM